MAVLLYTLRFLEVEKFQWHYRKEDLVKSLLNSILKSIILKIYITFYGEFPHAALLEINRLKLSSS